MTLPTVWAQASASDPTAVPLLALRRWSTSLTLSSPDPSPSRMGLWCWLLGLAALLAVVLVVQGPGRALRQLVNLAAHARLATAAVLRLRGAGRLVAVVFGAMVLSWTAEQAASYRDPAHLEDLVVLRRTKSLAELSVEQGMLAALTPLRDVAGLGDTLLLTLAAAVLAFKYSADRWGVTGDPRRDPAAGWSTLCWTGAGMYLLYRLALLVVPADDDLPRGGCLFVEGAVIPLLMALADGLLLAWALVELRGAGPAGIGVEGFDVRGAIALMPAAALASVAALPARYAFAAVWLSLQVAPSLAAQSWVTALVRGWGLVELQGAALVVAGLAGAVAFGRGGVGEALRGYLRLLRADGGHLVAVLAWGSLASGALAGLAYALVLSLPAQPWVLAAADAYAHFATLPAGLALLAALVELGARSAAGEEPAAGGD